ncbi:SCO family protein [Cellvibrio sp. QJXJ]|uniref:SCO family protein n=1 Tax=Cellvibrio sp. QJXJ TaxID=2964606 RepID=UPI0021C36846|nr:SCO family protein [Cellvibrio sp. QJXJ]UUA72488.1 SCO family protein [Cellvibrio sp. QJXJ]
MIRLIMVFAFCISVVSNVAAESTVTKSTETKSTALKSGVFDPPRMAPDFSLPSSRDNQFTLSEQRGKLLVLGFGFTNCPNVCPMTLANLAQVYKNLGALAGQVQVVYMTVDPERDTPARLREYLTNFNSHFVGVTGSADELAAVRQAYGIIAKKEVHKNGGNYEVHHSSYIYLIDRDGLLRALVPFGKSADDITHDIKILLQEKTQQAAL